MMLATDLIGMGDVAAYYWAHANPMTEGCRRYVEHHRLDLDVVNAHAGTLALMACRFDGDVFTFDATGTPACVIECLGEDGETVIDLCAWPVDRPERFATARRRAAGLGLANIGHAASWWGDRKLKVTRTPLAWLRDRSEGFCILDRETGPLALRRALGDLEATDEDLALALDAILSPPVFPHVIFVRRAE